MANKKENEALISAQIQALQAVVSKVLISDEIKKSISSLQDISLNVENIDISRFSEASAIINEFYLHNKEALLKASQNIATLGDSLCTIKLKELLSVFENLKHISVPINSGFADTFKGCRIPQIPKFDFNQSIVSQSHQKVVHLRLEGNDLVGRL